VTSKTVLNWKSGMQFESDVDGHQIVLDATPEHGGNGKGTTPKPLLLTSLAGCTGMDVVSLLVKMRVENYQFRIEVEGDQTEDYPVIYHTIHLNYHFIGSNLSEKYILRAVELSQTRYCGVYAMLSKSSKIITKVFINDKEIA
jgi:putative redox protein